MQALIFAAGKSTRTYPMTLTKPKPLLKILDKTIIEHTLDTLNSLIDEAVIIVGYKKEMIMKKIGTKYKNIKITYIIQKKQNGNGAALFLAKDYLKKKFLVMNSDDLFSKKDIKKCLKHDYCVLAQEVEDLSRFGELKIKDNSVTEIVEKPGKKKGLANTGVFVFSKKVFDYKIKKSKRGEYEITDIVKLLSKDGKKIVAEKIENYWIPISYPWNILDANELLFSKIKTKKEGIIEKGVSIKGEVRIGKNTVIKSGTYIEGPAIIGDDCVIGPNSYIRKNTVIGNNSKVGNAVELKNTIVGDNSCVAHLTYFGDSIIGDNVNIGAGTISANLRHDDKNVSSPVKKEMINTKRRKLGTIIADNVHIGINTTIYPGRKIWPSKTTLPGEIVKKDIL
ncbi:NTP transferase domain-containing protein [archaeon]|jgi:UDP-N-acetylglucosamine diphosphorylase / glucose-1-phosphate thymidylyltransferase / UDP-N-acetylgalactosamine diphosphorylase / glucosamine-1-phosphate N-acetyltransferase / galactosamine-1-phosphate N-acetyltransferase|nr:NTP transferase domain-containing protein [archaeon]